jgi:uracil phosphoribosyltransferase
MSNTMSNQPAASNLIEREAEFSHAYGERVHLIDSPTLSTLLSRLGGKEIRQPELVTVLRTVYAELFLRAMDGELQTRAVEVPTRMHEMHPREGVWRGEIIDPAQQLVFVDVIRAGLVPAQLCYELCSSLLPDENLRVDHLNMSRVTDDEGRVIGVDLSGSKIGGSVEGRVLILPDPMGATGSTTIKAVNHYVESHGRPSKIIAMPMIATPEYLRAVLAIEGLVVYTPRLDRGLSSDEVLAAAPGVFWDLEKGLDELSYIVPGAGGIGEVLNNSWC